MDDWPAAVPPAAVPPAAVPPAAVPPATVPSTAVPPTLDELLAAGDAHGIMRACHSRRLEREGIPMFIGLVDERGGIPANTSAGQTDAGAAVAGLLERYHRELVPFARPDDEGALITAMQVVAYAHFAPGSGATPVEDEDGGIAEGVRV